jgi:hypothetical protein
MTSISTTLAIPISKLDRDLGLSENLKSSNLTKADYNKYIKEKYKRTVIIFRLYDTTLGRTRIDKNGKTVNHPLELKITSEYSIHPKDWDYNGKSKLDKVKQSENNSVKINIHLRDYGNEIKTIYLNDFKSKGIIPTTGDVKNLLYPTIVKEPEIKDFTYYWNLFYTEKASTVSPNSLKNYKNLKSHIDDYQIKTGTILSIESSDKVSRQKFRDYLISKGMLNESIITIEKSNVSFFNWCIDGEHTFRKYRQLPPLKKSREPKGIITYNQQAKLSQTKFNDSGLEDAKNILLLACEVGLRYSDFSTLERNNIKDNHLVILTKKTSSSVKIPLTERAKNILTRIIDKSIIVPSNDNINKRFKEICKHLWGDEKESWTRYSGNNSIKHEELKYKLVGFHMTRRTFISNLLIDNVPHTTVMMYSGHKSLQSLLTYVNIPQTISDKVILESLNKGSLEGV